MDPNPPPMGSSISPRSLIPRPELAPRLPGRGSHELTPDRSDPDKPEGPPMPTCLIAVGGPLPHADTAGGGGAALNDIWPMAPVSVDAMRRSASSSLRGGTHG